MSSSSELYAFDIPTSCWLQDVLSTQGICSIKYFIYKIKIHAIGEWQRIYPSPGPSRLIQNKQTNKKEKGEKNETERGKECWIN